jgi:hypothetical protein
MQSAENSFCFVYTCNLSSEAATNDNIEPRSTSLTYLPRYLNCPQTVQFLPTHPTRRAAVCIFQHRILNKTVLNRLCHFKHQTVQSDSNMWEYNGLSVQRASGRGWLAAEVVQAEENRRRGSTSNAVGMNILKVGLQVHFEVRLGC